MIQIIAIGKIKESSMQAMIDEYAKRLKPVHQISVVELANSVKKETDIRGIIDDESARILSKIDEKAFVILLDLQGKDLSSEDMSTKLIDTLDRGLSITFVIGGSHGVSDAIRSRAQFRWKISNLTFPHQLIRVMLFEQIYRMFMIAKNHPYHK